MKKVLLAVAFMLVANLGMAQQEAFKKDVLKYFQVSGMSDGFADVVNMMSENIPADKKEAFKKEVTASIDDILNKMALLYMKELTPEDIKSAIKFYETPAGKKLVTASKSDLLNNLSEEWGAKIGEIMAKYGQQ